MSAINYDLLYPGAFTLLKVFLPYKSRIKAEADAMVAMSSTIDVEGKMEGGVIGGLARRFLSGESFFFCSGQVDVEKFPKIQKCVFCEIDTVYSIEIFR